MDGSNLLSSLRPQDASLIEPHVSETTFSTGQILYEPGDIVEHCYFPRGHAVASFHVVLDEGAEVETAIVGREGALGGIVSHGRLPAFARSTVMHGGSFYRIASSDLERAKQNSPQIAGLFARYADCLMAQVFQSVACNANHTIEQRAAKWLCAAVQRTGNSEVTMRQDQLASMMGIGRSYVSRVLARFKAAGLVATRRGGLKVLDQDHLQAIACACNDHVRNHFETVLRGVYPDGEETSPALVSG